MEWKGGGRQVQDRNDKQNTKEKGDTDMNSKEKVRQTGKGKEKVRQTGRGKEKGEADRWRKGKR